MDRSLSKPFNQGEASNSNNDADQHMGYDELAGDE